mmetsp:Transcript_41264/g.94963  ORF Transcript_41264/g.94963 Transcript_41264/m.94963 type:complete len:502 (-) Transcript_41264:187-1692(-)
MPGKLLGKDADRQWQDFAAVVPPNMRMEGTSNGGHVLHVPPAIEAFGDGGTSVSVALKPEPRSEKYGQGGDYSTTMSESMVVRRLEKTDLDSEVEWPRQIGIGFKVENIVQVDTLNCTFTAVVKISCEWKLSVSEYALWQKDRWRGSGFRPPWEPIIELVNAQKVEYKQELRVPYFHYKHCFDVFNYAGAYYTIVYTRYRCVFSENYELNNFPFDCQDLTFTVRSVDHRRAVLLPRFKRPDFAVMDASTFYLHEWEVHPPVASFSIPEKMGIAEPPKSEFVFQVKLKRRYHFYVYRIVVLAGSLTAASLLTWTVDLDLPHRLMLCFTIFLTLVAFQTTMANKLPQVRYFTLLDYYLVGCQRFMMIVAVEHGVLGRWGEDEGWLDNLCGLVTVMLYVLLQVAWSALSFRRARLEEEKITLNSLELRSWMTFRRQHVLASAAPVFKVTSCPSDVASSKIYKAGKGSMDRKNSFCEATDVQLPEQFCLRKKGPTRTWTASRLGR